MRPKAGEPILARISRLYRLEKWSIARLGSLRDDGHLAVSTAIEFPPGKVFPGAAPLLEEERDFRRAALTVDVFDPFLAHGPRLRTGFAANDHPMDTGEFELKGAQEGFT